MTCQNILFYCIFLPSLHFLFLTAKNNITEILEKMNVMTDF